MALEASEDQMNYPTLYASSRNGWAVKDRKDQNRKDLSALFDTIVENSKFSRQKVSRPIFMLFF